MTNKKAIGRPYKVNYTVMSKLEDALRSGASVTQACEYAGISRDTYYRHFRDEVLFAQKMKEARTNLFYLSNLGDIVDYGI